MLDSSYFIRVLIFGQPLFWMWLYDRDVDLSAYRDSFYVFSCAFCVVTLIRSVFDNHVFQFYTAWLLFLYGFMVIFVTWALEEKFCFRQSLCLGFLLVYFNSYVWEFVLHFASYRVYGITSNDILQMQHLIVLPWLLKKYKLPPHFDRKIILNGLQMLLLLETVVALLIFEVGNKRIPSLFIARAFRGFLLHLVSVY